MTDYSTMTGAEFQRAVGADPEKWAEAFMQMLRHEEYADRMVRDDVVQRWFRDAMAAAADEALNKAHTWP